jgi:hypothetical protein
MSNFAAVAVNEAAALNAPRRLRIVTEHCTDEPLLLAPLTKTVMLVADSADARGTGQMMWRGPEDLLKSTWTPKTSAYWRSSARAVGVSALASISQVVALRVTRLVAWVVVTEPADNVRPKITPSEANRDFKGTSVVRRWTGLLAHIAITPGFPTNGGCPRYLTSAISNRRLSARPRSSTVRTM